MSEENIIHIASAIDAHRNEEIKNGINNLAVGRVSADLNGTPKEIWLINRSAILDKNVSGGIGGTLVNQPLQGSGHPVNKNSRLGELLIRNMAGSFDFTAPGGNVNVEIFNRTFYIPDREEKARDLRINIGMQERPSFYASLNTIVNLNRNIEKDAADLRVAQEQNEEEEIARLVKSLEEKKEILKNTLEDTKAMIRKSVGLRFLPILDPIQEAIKRSKIFDGKLIINGGPGTGKTTSLIQRMKFLISEDITEYRRLSSSQLQVLSDTSAQWVFFTPSELLSLYLRNAMSQEGLPASNQTVKIWADQKAKLLREYGLTNPDTQKPFMRFTDTHSNLLLGWYTGTSHFIRNFTSFLCKFHDDRLAKVENHSFEDLALKKVNSQIHAAVNNAKFESELDIMHFYFNLRLNHEVFVNEINKEFNELSNRLAAEVLVNLNKSTAIKEEVLNLVKTFTAGIQDDDKEIDTEEDEVTELPRENNETNLLLILKSFIQQAVLINTLSTFSWNKNNLALSKIIQLPLQDSRFVRLGELALFNRTFSILTKGIVQNIYKSVPTVYKNFRKQEFNIKSKSWNRKVLKELVHTEQNTMLHIDEQAFLIFFINNLNRTFARNFNDQYRNSSHIYIEKYNQNAKAVIAIDEASDFALIDLLCMSSFNHYDFDSVTLSGDIMQRITKSGIASWKDYAKFFPKKIEVKDLKVSYRQSQTLLNLAGIIHREVNGEELAYQSYLPFSEAEPKPLLFIHLEEDQKIKWIVDRIREIYKTYDSLPSTAIFVANENHIDDFVKRVHHDGSLNRASINIIACPNGQVLGDPGAVRVFSIDKIKGLEFDAVFFHNVDDMATEVQDSKLLLKHIYVGLSRAAFYLALTAHEEFGSDFSFMSKLPLETNATWSC